LGKVKTILFSMTGMGNSAVETLTEHAQINLAAVFTGKRQEKPFPYYHCDPLFEAVRRKGIDIYEGLSIKDARTFDIIRSLCPELIVVSTFNQIITKRIIRIPKYGVINVHPSLLPQYRGTTPTVWALLNGGKKTGITVHFIEDETIDSGRIILQSELKILSQDTDGMLRFRLAELSKETLSKAINLILSKNMTDFPLQDESKATYFPKRSVQDAGIDLNEPFPRLCDRIRAMTPYPGAFITYRDLKYIVKSAVLLNSTDALCDERNEFLDIETTHGVIRFFLEGVICE